VFVTVDAAAPGKREADERGRAEIEVVSLLQPTIACTDSSVLRYLGRQDPIRRKRRWNRTFRRWIHRSDLKLVRHRMVAPSHGSTDRAQGDSNGRGALQRFV
jgi:hypothetical protein